MPRPDIEQSNIKPGGYSNDPAEVLIQNARVRAEVRKSEIEEEDEELDETIAKVRADEGNARFKKKK